MTRNILYIQPQRCDYLPKVSINSSLVNVSSDSYNYVISIFPLSYRKICTNIIVQPLSHTAVATYTQVHSTLGHRGSQVWSTQSIVKQNEN